MAEDLEMPLADVVRSLRDELQQAIADGDQSKLRFALDGIELEVDVRVGRERSGGGGSASGSWTQRRTPSAANREAARCG